MQKVLSIITPVYNRADCVEGCLESVAKQTVPDGWSVEHVVQDDGSADDTPLIVENFAAKHPHVVFSRFEHNRGTNAARNAAIRRASGRWIVLLDSDDAMRPEAIAKICGAIDNNPEFSHITFPTEATKALIGQLGPRAVLTYQDFLVGKYSGDFVHIFQRQTALQFPFMEDLRIFEELNFLRIYKKAGTILFCGEEIYSIDRHRTDHVTFTLRLTNNNALKQKLKAALLKIEMYADDYNQTEEGKTILNSELTTAYKLSVLLGEYNKAEELEKMARGVKIPLFYRLLKSTRLGPTGCFFAKNILRLKHKLRHN